MCRPQLSQHAEDLIGFLLRKKLEQQQQAAVQSSVGSRLLGKAGEKVRNYFQKGESKLTDLLGRMRSAFARAESKWARLEDD